MTLVQRFDSALRLNSSLRSAVVPTVAPTTAAAEPQLPEQLQLWNTNADGDRTGKPPACGRHPWAWLLKRVYKIDVTVCPKCQGKFRVLETVTQSEAVARLRAEQNLAPIPPP